jgi:uncharacterized membrane protein
MFAMLAGWQAPQHPGRVTGTCCPGRNFRKIQGDPMIFSGREAHSRSLMKAISWRATGTIDTFVISYIITGHAVVAGSIAGTELLTKILLYYFHERVWASISWGAK